MRFLSILLLILFAGSAAAQSDDRGILQAFIEDNLSDVGREVRIEGFRGALSSRAELDRLTIADEAGIWLTIEGATLDWNRAAVLRGNIEIRELSADAIILVRPPEAETTAAPSPEATPIAVPELPVSIDIAELSIARLELGDAFLGTPIDLRFLGAAQLAGGAAQLTMDAERLNGPDGRFQLSAALDNATRNLTLDLLLDEAPDGLAATLIGLPGNPDVRLAIAGDGPLDDFTADLHLATDGIERITGTVTVQGAAPATENETTITAFDAIMSGDLRPLVADETYHAFLGANTRLATRGTRAADGAIAIESLNLQSVALTLNGAVGVEADGWPSTIDLEGRIKPPSGDSVVLPLGNPDMRIAAADIALTYFQTAGDTWQLQSSVDRFSQPGLNVSAMTLLGVGTIDPQSQQVTGALNAALSGFETDDVGLNTATGSDFTADLAFDWQPDAPLSLTDIRLSGDDYAATGDVQISGVDGAVDLDIAADLALQAQDLSRFSDLSGQTLDGAANLTIDGTLSPVSGAFSAQIKGTTLDLQTGIAQVDPLVLGTTQLDLAARRNATGLTIENLTLEGADAFLGLAGQVSTTASNLALNARVGQVERILDGLTGAASLSGTVRQDNDTFTFDLSATAPGQTLATLEGTTVIEDGQPGQTTVETTLRSNDLTAFRQLAGLALSGSVNAIVRATGHVTDGTGSADIVANTTGLRTGIPEADLALGRAPNVTTRLRRTADGTTFVEAFDLRSQEVTANATGQFGPSQSALRYDVALRDVGLFVDQLSGPVTSNGTISANQGPWQINSALTAPGGTTAQLNGSAAQDFSRFDLGVTGSTALALANTVLAPNLIAGTAAFDLRLSGPPDLQSLSGTIQTRGAQFTSPAAPAALDDINATITLSAGQARIDTRARVSSGGRVTADGIVDLNAPNRGDIRINLDDIIVSDPGFIESSLNGTFRLRGPLSNGATVAGQIDLGQTEIRIPDAVGASGADIPGLVHLNEPAPVRASRIRAGLIASDEATTVPGADYPLDVVISAPSRVFIRGRGLDAELGGRLRVTGSTQNIATQGRFELIRGRLDILGQRLTLSEASAQLLGDFDPRIRAVATTQAADTTINIIVDGTASSPNVSFTSSPSLPEDEVLARLLVGRELSQISAFQALRIANAIRVLSGQAGEGIVGRLRNSFGLDDLDVTTTEDNTTAVSAGRYLNENVYTGVTVDSTGKSEINLNLSVSPSVTLRGNVDSTGNSGVGVFFERDY